MSADGGQAPGSEHQPVSADGGQAPGREHQPTGAADDAIQALARLALASYGLDEDASVQLCNVSENHTFRIRDRGGAEYALRVHRPGYRTVDEIRSELRWLDALAADGAVLTPAAVPALDGERVVAVKTPELGTRNVVLFEWAPGVAPDLDSGEAATGQFRTLGAISARMHLHARRWRHPSGFVRPRWDFEHSIGPRGHWGRWQDGLGIDREALALLERLVAVIEARLRAFGQGERRFGLVHADMRLANLLIDGEQVRVIDFDDCGFSWFMYDFATTVSFMEDHPRVPELQRAWVDGYRSVAQLDAEDEQELDTFVMLRRLLLVAWIGSHHTFATEAAELGAGFADGTCALAERYLSTHRIP
ncbi:MAG TPA: phosphotransferase [Solirubrobacteraceae bacterium]|nr:phosphotransferase [Solirubrobacteraceae bacterium]